MIATSGFLTALECIKFVVFGRRRRSIPDATGSGVLDHLGHGPPLKSEKFFAYDKNATLEKFDSQENS